jgi:hypothetical protein
MDAGSDDEPGAATAVTVVTGRRFEIQGAPEKVEAAIVGASRGSIMQLAWLTEAGSGRAVGINPIHVVAVEAADGPAPGS